MARAGAFPLGFRVSARPVRIIACCDLVFGSSKRIGEQFPFSRLKKTCSPNLPLPWARSFSSSSNSNRADGRGGTPLPWLSASTGRNQRRVGNKEISKSVKSSWEVSAEKFLKGPAVDVREPRRFEDRGNEFGSRNDDGGRIEDEEDKEGEIEVINDPRWSKIRDRFKGQAELKPRVYDRPEVRRWSNQENWGRKTWKEAKESSVPRMVGEGVYGVGPVLAALSSGRREFYSLYVQEGLDLSSNNKKKKDKKGFEKVLRLAEKLELNIREISKHDLNMVVDNRPHQGLVLDASPLEMVGIKELEPVSGDSEKGLLWLALDEVMDPQNLGAIIRSAYFFGACGVVLCAKNSAPLSGVVSKASAGSLEVMEMRSCKNMMQFLTSSSENGWRVVGGSVSQRAVPLSEIVAGEPTILVLGSEGTGLRPLVERSCSELVRIPGNLPVDFVEEDSGEEFRSFLAVESLNVSVAAGVLLHHFIGGMRNGSSN